MKKEIALLLADAITSGHYKRGAGYNRTSDNKFCIGGVLINLFAQAHPDLAAKERDPLRFMGTNSSIPEAVMKWADIKYCNMSFIDDKKHKIGKGNYNGLRHANDAGASFEELANWLRKGKNHERI